MNNNSFNLNIVNEQMIKIPEGRIELRDDRIKHKWNVEILPFLISKYPVTQELYFEITNENPSTFKGSKKPIETVSWIEAINFCNLLSKRLGLEIYYLVSNNQQIIFNEKSNGFRLPSEAEWEYSCKSGGKEPRYGEIDKIAWYKENSNQITNDVGLKNPNIWGIFDMLGNIWEWCSDIYDENVYGEYRIFRGGGWNDNERGCLATNRRRSHPTFKIDDLGFRIARNL